MAYILKLPWPGALHIP